MDSEKTAPFYPLSDTNHAGWVVIASLVFFVYAVLGLVAKIVLRFNITSLKLHDILLVAATISLFVQTICVLLSAGTGLGQHQKSLEQATLERYNKITYVSSILALVILGCTKLSLCLLINAINSHGSIFEISPVKHGINQGRLHIANLSQFGVVVIWIATGIPAVVFQCSLPSPWRSTEIEHCPARGAIHVYNGVMNMLTDLSLCIFPIAMMWKVHTTAAKKVQVILLFGTRLIVPITTAPAVFTASYLFNADTDDTWLAVTPTIWFQISLSLSILTACIPSLKSLIDSLLGSTAGATIQAPYELKDIGGRSNLRATALATSSNRSASAKLPSILRGKGNFKMHQQVSSGNPRSKCYSDVPDGKPVRSDSTRNLTEGVIHRSDQFEVQYEERTGSSVEESLDGRPGRLN